MVPALTGTESVRAGKAGGLRARGGAESEGGGGEARGKVKGAGQEVCFKMHSL